MARARTTWTRQQAAEAGARGREAQRLRAAKRSQEPAELNGLLRALDFADLLLARTRAHVHNLNSVLADELTRKAPDATKIDRLASAWERLAEVERRLAGRPLPGSRRPPPSDATRPTTVPAPEPTPQAPAGSTARELADLDELEYSPPP